MIIIDVVIVFAFLVAVAWMVDRRTVKSRKIKDLLAAQDRLINQIEKIARDNRDIDLAALNITELINDYKRKTLL